ncbi:MAG: leucine-rich repeat protein [Velocimicrobium sp.]
MQEIYQYSEENDEILIKAYKGDAAHISIPYALLGKKVTQLLPYAFSNLRFIESVCIPEGVEAIGDHCFYDCRMLKKLVMSDRIKYMGDGVLKNCLSFHELELDAKAETMYPLKGVLSEVNEEILVRIYYGELREKVELLFPRYLHDYEENTMARIINQVTYGCGVHYRECVNDEQIDFDSYDELFSFAKANEEERVVEMIALLRIRYPFHLWKEKKKIYLEYLGEHFVNMATHLIRADDMSQFQFLLGLPIVKKEWMDELLIIAQRAEKIEYSTLLLTIKGRKFGNEKKTFLF